MPVSSNAYHYDVFFSTEDNAYIGACREFPSLSAVEETEDEAAQQIRKIVEFVLQMLAENRAEAPVPLLDDERN